MKKLTLAIFALATLAISCKQEKPTPPNETKQYTIEQFYKNEQIGGGAWSPDESKLLVQSNKTGIYNLYEINVADGLLTERMRSFLKQFGNRTS